MKESDDGTREVHPMLQTLTEEELALVEVPTEEDFDEMWARVRAMNSMRQNRGRRLGW